MGSELPLSVTPIPGVEIREASLDDCFELAPILREIDKKEIKMSSGEEPLAALILSWGLSEHRYVATKDGVPFLMFGVVRITGTEGGCIWLLGSDLIEQMPKTFMRKSRQWIDHLAQDYAYLTNAIMEENTVHLKWIVFLGAELVNRVPEYGPGKQPFIFFMRRK